MLPKLATAASMTLPLTAFNTGQAPAPPLPGTPAGDGDSSTQLPKLRSHLRDSQEGSGHGGTAAMTPSSTSGTTTEGGASGGLEGVVVGYQSGGIPSQVSGQAVHTEAMATAPGTTTTTGGPAPTCLVALNATVPAAIRAGTMSSAASTGGTITTTITGGMSTPTATGTHTTTISSTSTAGTGTASASWSGKGLVEVQIVMELCDAGSLRVSTHVQW